MKPQDDHVIGIYPKSERPPFWALVLLFTVIGLAVSGAWAILSLLG